MDKLNLNSVILLGFAILEEALELRELV